MISLRSAVLGLGVAALGVLSLQGCVDDSGGVADLSDRRAQWRKQEPALYAYTVTRSCFCIGGPVQVTASRDSVISAQELSGGRGSPIPAGTLVDVERKQDYSIEAVFDEVDSMVNRSHESHNLSFDETYGFPDSFYIDLSKQMADDEYGLYITDFKVVTPIQIDPYDGQGVKSGTATLTLKGYLGLCGDLRPDHFECPIVSVDGGAYKATTSPIHGFAFEWGKEAMLKVDVMKAPENWQDVPNNVFTVIEKTKSTPAPAERFQIHAVTHDFMSATGGVLRLKGYGKNIPYTGALPPTFTGEKAAADVFRLTLDMDAAGELRLHLIERIPGVVE